MKGKSKEGWRRVEDHSEVREAIKRDLGERDLYLHEAEKTYAYRRLSEFDWPDEPDLDFRFNFVSEKMLDELPDLAENAEEMADKILYYYVENGDPVVVVRVKDLERCANTHIP